MTALIAFILSAWTLVTLGIIGVCRVGKSADHNCAVCGYDPLLHYNLTGRCALRRECSAFKEKA